MIKLRGRDVACVTGFNKWNPCDDDFYQTIHDYNMGCRRDVMPHEKIVTDMPQDKLREIVADDTVCDEDLASEVTRRLTEQVEAASKQNGQIKADIQMPDIDDATATAIAAAVEQSAGIKRGLDCEEIALDTYQAAAKVKVTKRNAQLHTYEFMAGKYKFLVRSMFDGMVGDRIIETKERRNRMFSCIPIYEKIQLEVYMRTIDVHKATHIQNFGGKQKIVEYTRNDQLWNSVLERLEAFGDKYAEKFGGK